MLQVSRTRRLTQVIISVLFNLTCAGVIFGFAALKPVLVREGVYADLCEGDDQPEFGSPCNEQDLRLNYMFTLSTVITNAVALPVGALLDRIGPKYASLIGAAIFALGNVLFPLDYRSAWIDTYFIGYICLAIGGPLIFLSSFHLSNTFPTQAGLILSCVTGAFDASSIPYLVYDIVYDKAGPISLKAFFWSYAIVPALLVIFQLTLAPSQSYQRDDFGEHAADRHHQEPSSGSSVSGSEEDGLISPTVAGSLQDESMARGLETHLASSSGKPDGIKGGDRDRIVGVMFDRPAGDQIASAWFCAIAFFLCIYMARINYYIQTVFQQLLFYLGDYGLARTITRTFTVLLPLGGIAGIPFVGFLLDHRTTFEASVVVLVCGVVYGALGLVPHVAAQTISIAIFVFLRPLMYTFVGDYCGKVFGFATFGTVYGLANSVAGVFGLILRPVDVLVKNEWQGDYVGIDVIGAGLGLMASGLLTWKIWQGTRRVRLE